MARPTNGAPGKLPEFLSSHSLGAWFTAWLDDRIERLEAEAAEAGLSRAARVELDNAKRAASQIESYHAESAA